MENENRILHYKWDLYDTRHVVYKTKALSAAELKEGYDWALSFFYSWTNIWKAKLATRATETRYQTFYIRRWLEKI
jgi:hypothetical protein